MPYLLLLVCSMQYPLHSQDLEGGGGGGGGGDSTFGVCTLYMLIFVGKLKIF